MLRTTTVHKSITKGGGEFDDDFAERLQAAIDEAREEIERETEQYRQDLEKSYKSKVSIATSGGRGTAGLQFIFFSTCFCASLGRKLVVGI